MQRTALTNEDGKWFDIDTAQKFEEETFWNGNNNISMCAGGQYAHQILYRTKSSKWILHEWSQMQGSNESYEEVSDQEAAAWFMKNEYDDIPDDLMKILADDIKDLEV